MWTWYPLTRWWLTLGELSDFSVHHSTGHSYKMGLTRAMLTLLVCAVVCFHVLLMVLVYREYCAPSAGGTAKSTVKGLFTSAANKFQFRKSSSGTSYNP